MLGPVEGRKGNKNMDSPIEYSGQGARRTEVRTKCLLEIHITLIQKQTKEKKRQR